MYIYIYCLTLHVFSNICRAWASPFRLICLWDRTTHIRRSLYTDCRIDHTDTRMPGGATSRGYTFTVMTCRPGKGMLAGNWSTS